MGNSDIERILKLLYSMYHIGFHIYVWLGNLLYTIDTWIRNFV